MSRRNWQTCRAGYKLSRHHSRRKQRGTGCGAGGACGISSTQNLPPIPSGPKADRKCGIPSQASIRNHIEFRRILFSYFLWLHVRDILEKTRHEAGRSAIKHQVLSHQAESVGSAERIFYFSHRNLFLIGVFLSALPWLPKRWHSKNRSELKHRQKQLRRQHGTR